MALFNYECDEVKRKIIEVKPNYPQLTTYESEWLYFHEHHYNPGTPVELEYETVNVNPTGMILNAIPFQYKSAILKGNTDENLQSVEMPVLKTTGKNLFDKNKATKDSIIGPNGKINPLGGSACTDYIRVENGKTYINPNGTTIGQYDINKTFISRTAYMKKFVATYDGYIRWNLASSNTMDTLQIEEGSVATEYEPYQSNILTVNEDVTLRSNGSVYDELDLLTGKLTQRIDEDGSVLTQEVVKTVALTPLNKPYEGTNHYELTSNIPCEAILEVPVVSTGKQTLVEINN